MRVLLDTHVILWAVSGDTSLPSRYRTALEDLANDIYISAVSEWEIAIKRSAGKLDLPATFFDTLDTAEYDSLSVTRHHAHAVHHLQPIHIHPLDPLLIASAQCEALTLATVDTDIWYYDVPILYASFVSVLWSGCFT